MHYNLIILSSTIKIKRQHRIGCPYSKDKGKGRKDEAANGVVLDNHLSKDTGPKILLTVSFDL